MPWTPASKLPFLRTHKKAADCSDLKDLYHLGGHYYLSANSRTLTITKGKNVSDIALSPLMIYHFPCDVKFPDQRTGLGNCPKRLTVDIPIFTDSTIRYVPWEDIMDDTIPTLLLESLKIPPVTPVNKSTLESLDKTFQSLDQNFDEQLDQLSSDISLIKETTTPTINDILTYLAFTMALANLYLLIFFRCHSRFRRSPGTARLPAKIISTNPEQIELDSLPKCEDCHRPRCSSV